MRQKYVIAGSGATGGSIGAFLAQAGQDVTFLARGAQLAAFREKGITMKGTAKGDFRVFPIKAMTMEEYTETPDVIFVCVKDYSLEDAIALRLIESYQFPPTHLKALSDGEKIELLSM